jgi:MoaA/NifB/PqqE/SkfB family radical SAM enzyme
MDGEEAGKRSIAEPYLNLHWDRIYNPLTNRTILPNDLGYGELRAMASGKRSVDSLSPDLKHLLESEGWIIPHISNEELSKRFYLKFVSIEANTVCNQECYFCPVSINPREEYFMPIEFYEDILRQLSVYRNTVELVFMISYNEPTADKRFVDQIRLIKKHGFRPAVNTNATGLTPSRSDEIMDMGGLGYLSVNLSTMDRERYKKDRGGDHVGTVIRNLDYIKDKKIAEYMDIAVLGMGDEDHIRSFREIAEHFSESYFNVKYSILTNRAGYLNLGLKTDNPHKKLRGCSLLGSRPLQHLHINPKGECFLCCQDYNNAYIVGDLNRQTVDEVLTGPEFAKMRRWIYGIEEAPADFICRGCRDAITAPDSWHVSKLPVSLIYKSLSLLRHIAQGVSGSDR